MIPVNASFEILWKENPFMVQSVSDHSGAMLYVITAEGFERLVLHRAKAISGEKFWTSIPEGRQKEAEIFGPLIERVMKSEELKKAPKTGQYPANVEDIYEGRVCPYCGQPSILTDSAEIYGQSYGNIYLCRPCQAWVGVHKTTNQALGRLGTKELRALHKEAHRWFDQLYEMDIIKELYPAYVQGMSGREKAYLWLAQQMGIKKEYCHIGYFDEQQSRQVIELCRPIVEKYTNP